MSAPENPPAFPRDHRHLGHNGMTLRDWFATHAPEPPALWWGGGRADCAGYAMWAFQYADAMLAARQEPAA